MPDGDRCKKHTTLFSKLFTRKTVFQRIDWSEFGSVRLRRSAASAASEASEASAASAASVRSFRSKHL